MALQTSELQAAGRRVKQLCYLVTCRIPPARLTTPDEVRMVDTSRDSGTDSIPDDRPDDDS